MSTAEKHPDPVPGLALQRGLSWTRVLIQAGSIALVGALAIGLASTLLYDNERRDLDKGIRSEATLNTSIQRDMILHEIRHMAHATLFFAEQVESHQAIQTRKGLEQLQQDFLSYMASDHSMGQVRLLDLSGRELLRVSFNNGYPSVAHGPATQDSSGQYYFRQMQDLTHDAMYISDIDLHSEGESIQRPLKPLIRMGMAIANEHGTRVGYLIINYLANNFLDRFRASAGLTPGNMLWLDADGHALSSQRAGQAWRHKLQPGTPPPLPPRVLQRMQEMHSGTFHSGKGVFIFTTLQPGEALLNVPSIHSVKTGPHSAWRIVVHLSDADFTMLMTPYRSVLLRWSLIVLAVLLAGAIPLAVLAERKHIATAYSAMLIQAIEHAGEAVMITRPDASIEYINPAFSKLTGYSREEALGKKPSDLIKSHVQGEDFYRRMWSSISSGKLWSGNLINRRKDGSLFPAEIVITPVRDKQGQNEHYVSLQHDTSKSQLLQEELVNRKKMQAMSIAVGGIAHEFNNILAGLLGNAYLVRRLNEDNPDAVARLESIESLGRRAADIIQQMLVYAGEGELQFSPLDISALGREAAEAYASAYDDRPRLHTQIAPGPLMVMADAAALRHVLDELMDNARKAVAGMPDGEITLSLAGTHRRQIRSDGEADEDRPRIDAQYVEIIVKDNGCGIPAEHLELLFEPFFTTRDAGQGTGMGLADASGIIRQHHGMIEVNSEPGQGTDFHVLLPLAEA